MLRIARLALVGFLFALALYAAYARYPRSTPTYTLREALWVSDRDMKSFHPPLSPESLFIVDLLKTRGFPTDTKEYQSYVLYRGGLSTSDPPEKSLLILGFQPPSNPATDRMTKQR